MQSPSTATVGDYLRLLWRHVVVVVAATVLGAAGGYLAHLMQPAHYVSEARVITTVPGPATVYAARATDLAGQLRAESYRDMATSPILIQRVVAADGARLGGELTVDDVRGRVTATTYPDSAVIAIDATGDSAEAASTLAAAVATQLKQLVEEIEETREGGPQIDMAIIDSASGPAKTPETPWTTAVGLGGGIGLGLALLGVLAADLTRNRVRDSRDAIHSLRDAWSI